MFNFHILEDFPVLFFFNWFFDSCLITVREHTLYDFSSFKFADIFMVQDTVYPGECFMDTWKKVYSAVGDGVFYTSQLKSFS